MNEHKLKLRPRQEEEILSKLTDYVRGNLTPVEQWEIEEAMHHDEAISDALEGLKKIVKPGELKSIELALNMSITKKIAKNHKKHTKLLKFPLWIILLLTFLLLTVLAGYVIIDMLS